MRDTEIKWQNHYSNQYWRVLSDPRLLHLTVNSLFLIILFSFRSHFINYGRCYLKTDSRWKYWEASKPFFLYFLFNVIYEILELGFHLFQQVLGQFRQILLKSACFSCLRPRWPLLSTCEVCEVCLLGRVREPRREGPEDSSGHGRAFRRARGLESGYLGSVLAPPLSDSKKITQLFQCAAQPSAKSGQLLQGYWDKSVTKNARPRAWHVVSTVYQRELLL